MEVITGGAGSSRPASGRCGETDEEPRYPPPSEEELKAFLRVWSKYLRRMFDLAADDEDWAAAAFYGRMLADLMAVAAGRWPLSDARSVLASAPAEGKPRLSIVPASDAGRGSS